MLDYRSMLQTQLEQAGVHPASIEKDLYVFDGLLAISRCTPKEAYDTVIGERTFVESQQERERIRRLHPPRV